MQTIKAFSRAIQQSKPTASETKNNSWQATSWEGQGQLAINTPGISLDSNAKIIYQANSIENGNKNIIEIKSANLKAGASNLLSTGAEVKDLIITQGSNNKWTPQSWTAIGSPNLNTNSIKISGEVDINYNRDAATGESTYTISEAKIDQSAPNSLMRANAKALDIVIKQNNKGGWDLQQWVAVGKLRVPIQGINIAGDAQVYFKKAELANNPDQFTVKQASIAQSKGDIFKTGATISNLELTKNSKNQWIPKAGKHLES